MSNIRSKNKSNRPRLSVFRSSKRIYAQVIDDTQGKTLVAAFGKDGQEVGKKVAAAAIKAKVEAVVFDRSNYKYHGQVKKLADAAREGGLKF